MTFSTKWGPLLGVRPVRIKVCGGLFFGYSRQGLHEPWSKLLIKGLYKDHIAFLLGGPVSLGRLPQL